MAKRQFVEVWNSVNIALRDILSENAPVQIKTCQARIHRPGSKSGMKNGRFSFYKPNHDFLVNAFGLYLFVVTWDCGAKRMRFIPAEDLPYQQQYSWRVIWDGGY